MSYHYPNFNAFGGSPWGRGQRPDMQRGLEHILLACAPTGEGFSEGAALCEHQTGCPWRARSGTSACTGCALAIANPQVLTQESQGPSSPRI